MHGTAGVAGSGSKGIGKRANSLVFVLIV